MRLWCKTQKHLELKAVVRRKQADILMLKLSIVNSN